MTVLLTGKRDVLDKLTALSTHLRAAEGAEQSLAKLKAELKKLDKDRIYKGELKALTDAYDKENSAPIEPSYTFFGGVLVYVIRKSSYKKKKKKYDESRAQALEEFGKKAQRKVEEKDIPNSTKRISAEIDRAEEQLNSSMAAARALFEELNIPNKYRSAECVDKIAVYIEGRDAETEELMQEAFDSLRTPEEIKVDNAEKAFRRALEQDPVPENDVLYAAMDGSISACLYLGKKWALEYQEGRDEQTLTPTELKKLYNISLNYLTRAAKAGLDEAIMFVIFLKINAGELYRKECPDALFTLRRILNGGQFPEYEHSLTASIHILVNEVSKLDENGEPVLKNKYCRYYDHGRCAYHVSHYSVAHCNYPTDPGQCSIALNQKAIVYEY